jgi:CelD/BcsL family acetyltransferase involved in cellulose biosynthesis
MTLAFQTHARPGVREQTSSLAQAALRVSVLDLVDGMPVLDAILAQGVSSPSSDPRWITAWAKHVNASILVAAAWEGDMPLAAVALELTSHGGVTVARFVGGRHANGNFPALARALSASESATFCAGLKRACAARGVQLLALERQHETLHGLENPLLSYGSTPSPNIALAVDVSDGFEALLERHSGKRKRKRFRSSQRKFEAAGDFAVHNPVPAAAAADVLDAYFAMKAQQFKKRGLPDAFGDAGEQAFFKELLGGSHESDRHHFYVSTLNAGGKVRAVMGSSLHRDVQSVHFMAYGDDELAQASPGDFLNHMLIEQACARGLKTYDLGVGDEGYKRAWCDAEIWQRDTIAGISPRGRLLALQWNSVAAAKRHIKNTPALWSMVKTLRRRLAGKPADEATPSED